MLQRDKPIHIWGSVQNRSVSKLEIQLLLHDRKLCYVTCDIQADGIFSTVLPPQIAGEQYTLSFLCFNQDSSAFASSKKEILRLTNVSIGDIWLAGGQSNMEFFLKYDADYESICQLPKNPKIHLYNVPQRAFTGHNSHSKSGYGYWFTDDDCGIETFSAPGYSFARSLQEDLSIPIGIIGCNWGGSSASTWVPKEVLSDSLSFYLKEYEASIEGKEANSLCEESLRAWEFEDSDKHGKDFEPVMYGISREEQLSYMTIHKNDPVVPMGPYHFDRPAGLFETMLSRIISFSIKGVLWYQGESDAGERAPFYGKLLSGLIHSWRTLWNDDFPFLLVQLAPFGVWLDCDSTDYTTVRKMQQEVSDTIPDVYLTGISDIGSYYDIHPKKKWEVGRRLALLARGHVYGEPILCDCPRIRSCEWVDEETISLRFYNDSGLSLGEKDSDFLISLDGKRTNAIKPESVLLNGNTILLKLPRNEKILSDYATPPNVSAENSRATVSLGYGDFSEIFIKNAAGLPVLQFCVHIAPPS